jgi:hypothetical protein
LSCFFIYFFVFICCGLCICWDGYLFEFYMGEVFLMRSFLLKSQFPWLYRGEKADHSNNKNLETNQYLNITTVGNNIHTPNKDRKERSYDTYIIK